MIYILDEFRDYVKHAKDNKVTLKMRINASCLSSYSFKCSLAYEYIDKDTNKPANVSTDDELESIDIFQCLNDLLEDRTLISFGCLIYPKPSLVIETSDEKVVIAASTMTFDSLISADTVVVPTVALGDAIKPNTPVIVTIEYTTPVIVNIEYTTTDPLDPHTVTEHGEIDATEVEQKKESTNGIEAMTQGIRSKGYTNVVVSADGVVDEETNRKALMAEVMRHVNNIETGNTREATGTTTSNNDVHITAMNNASEEAIKEYRAKVFAEGAIALKEKADRLAAANTEDDFNC